MYFKVDRVWLFLFKSYSVTHKKTTMSIKFATVIVSLTIATSSLAQISYGPKAGLNLAKLSFTNDDFKTSFKPGFLVGGFVNYLLADKMSLQGELFFSLEGTKEERISSGSKGDIAKSYLQIPILFQYQLHESFYVEAGPQIGLLLSSKEKYGSSSRISIKDHYKSTDLRFPLGIGYHFSDKLTGLSLGLRYSFSLSKINTEDVGGGNLKNQVIGLGIQYRLPSK